MIDINFDIIQIMDCVYATENIAEIKWKQIKLPFGIQLWGLICKQTKYH